jgi:antitoxin MazE
MITTVQKWGNSLGVRIPKPVAQAKRLRPGSQVDLREEKNRLVIVPVEAPKIELADLLRGITKRNIHREADFGEPRGKEIW